MLRGKYHHRAKRYEPALRCYLRVAEIFPNHLLAHFRAGFCLVKLERHPEALAEYETALQIDPAESTIHAWMSIPLRHLGNLQAAAESMERAFRSCPTLKKPRKAAWWRDHLARIYADLGDWQRAAENFPLAWEANPKQDVLTNLGVAQWRSGEKETSLETRRKAASLFPNSADAHYQLGWALFNLGRNSEAIVPLRRAISLDPRHADAHYHLGLVLEEPDGLKFLRIAANLRPNHADTHYSVGVALGELKDYEGSIVAYREAVRLKPDHASAWYNMGVMYSEVGKPDDEIEAYKSALRCDDQKVDAWANLGLALGGKQMHQEALQAYRKVTEFSPDSDMGHYCVGFSLGSLGHLAEAIPHFERAIQIDPGFIMAWSCLGTTYANLGRFLDAFACYETAMRLAPNSAELHRQLADFYEWRGQETQAAQLRAKADGFKSQGLVDPLDTIPKRPIDRTATPPQE